MTGQPYTRDQDFGLRMLAVIPALVGVVILSPFAAWALIVAGGIAAAYGLLELGLHLAGKGDDRASAAPASNLTEGTEPCA